MDGNSIEDLEFSSNERVCNCNYMKCIVVVYSKLFKQKKPKYRHIYGIVLITDDCVISIIVSKNKRLSMWSMTSDVS